MKRFLFYLLYAVFVMALTTSVVWTKVDFDKTKSLGKFRSFFVKRRCYVVEGKEPVAVEKCPCECHPRDRKWSDMSCNRCGHFVDADIVRFTQKSVKKR